MTSPRQNARAYGFLTPALLVMTLTGLIPMAIVAFYSVNDTFAGNSFFFVGAAWFKQVLTSPEFFAALARSIGFSMLVLAIQVPLGIFIALRMPAKGFLSSFYIVLMAIPLLTPSIVVGYLWKVLSLPDIGEAFGGRDHTTVMHACRTIVDLRGKDSKLNNDLHVLIQTIKG